MSDVKKEKRKLKNSIYRYLGEYKKESILGPLFKLLEASFELIVPLVVAAIIDKGIGGSDKGYIVRMSAVMVALGIVGLISAVTAQFFAAKAAVGFSTRLRHELFAHIQKFSFSDIDNVGTSTMITRMTSDINQVQNGVNMVLRLFLRSPFIVFGAMIMAFTIDVKAAFVFVVVIPVLSVVVFAIMAISIPLYKKVQSGLDKVLGITRENLTGARVIRAFNKEQDEIREFDEAHENLTGLQMLVGRITGLMNPLTYIVINVGIIVLIYVGAIRVDSGVITQGEVVALVNYMSQILVELIKLANLIITVTKAVACGNRVQSVMDMQTDMEDGSKSVESLSDSGQYSDVCAVEFEDVGLVYKGASEEALSHITFKANKGDTIGIIGGTGSGKSSIVNMIPRFYDATSGKIKINGNDIKEYSIEELRKSIGIVMQKAVLFKGTIRDNMKWGNENATDEEIWEALDIAQASEFVKGKDKKLDTVVEQGGKNFSGGQRQRLTIARAVVRKPDILILDDSSSALDYATDARLRKAISGMSGDTTVFIVSQRTSSLRHADNIIVMDDGVIVGMGTHDELLKSCDVYKEINASQESGKEAV